MFSSLKKHINRFYKGSKLFIERKKMRSTLSVGIDIYIDKGKKMRFHITHADGNIIATSSPYEDLADMNADLNMLLYGRIKIAKS